MENVYTSDGVPGRYWHALADGRIQCDLCPRECKLHEGQRGLCFVRARTSNQIVLTTYGRSSGFCLDPIEKKPLNHFLPGTAVLSFGTAGCNLTCKFCQNWDISKARALDRLQQRASPQAIAQAACATGARSVAFTYNDPVIFLEFRTAIITRKGASIQCGVGMPACSRSVLIAKVPMIMFIVSQPSVAAHENKVGMKLPRSPNGARLMISVAVPARGPGRLHKPTIR